MAPTYYVRATKRRRGDHRAGRVAFKAVTWLARGTGSALSIARALVQNGWNVTRVWKRDDASVWTEGWNLWRFDTPRE